MTRRWVQVLRCAVLFLFMPAAGVCQEAVPGAGNLIAPSPAPVNDAVVVDVSPAPVTACNPAGSGDAAYCSVSMFATWSCSADDCRCNGSADGKLAPYYRSGRAVKVFFVFSDLGADDPHRRTDADIADSSCAALGCVRASNVVTCWSLGLL